jgi:hypothetical protein
VSATTTKSAGREAGTQRNSRPQARRPKEPIDYPSIFEVVKEVGFYETLTGVVDMYMDGAAGEDEPFDAVKAHPAFASFPHWLRQGVTDGGKDALARAIAVLVNVLTEGIHSNVGRLNHESTAKRWKFVIQQLHDTLGPPPEPQPSHFSAEMRKERKTQRGGSRNSRRRDSKSAERNRSRGQR